MVGIGNTDLLSNQMNGDDLNRLTTGVSGDNTGYGLGTLYDTSTCGYTNRPMCDAQMKTSCTWGSGCGIGGKIGTDDYCYGGCPWTVESGYEYDYAIFVSSSFTTDETATVTTTTSTTELFVGCAPPCNSTFCVKDGSIFEQPTSTPTPLPSPAPSQIPTALPSSSPTPVPSLDCADSEFIYRLNMFDSGGDGWQGATYRTVNSTSYRTSEEGSVIAHGTMENGYQDTVWLCLRNGCYELIVGGGNADSEISFNFVDEIGGHFQDLNAPFSDHFCVQNGDVFLFWRFSSLTGQQSGPRRPTRTLPAAAARASGRPFST